MKHEARIFDMTSQSRLKIQCNKACKINIFLAGMVNSSCKSECRLTHVGSVLLHLLVVAEKKKRKTESFSFAEKCI